MYKNKKTILIGLSDSDYNLLKIISNNNGVSVVQAVRIAIRAYTCSRSTFSLSRLACEISSVRDDLKELLTK